MTRKTAPPSFVLGLDFGTLSARTLLVNAATGEEVASVVFDYPSGVIDHVSGRLKGLDREAALQDPADYLTFLRKAIPRTLKKSGVPRERVKAIGVDFTSCTILPTRHDGTPLCELGRFRKNPHAWVKLWKHHSAQAQADRINEVGERLKERFIHTYGGKYSSEWFFSKVLETLEKAPAVYEAADRFLEAGDWIVWKLCGQERRCASAAGFKALRVYPDPKSGWTFPAPCFFRELHPEMENVIQEKVGEDFFPLSTMAGGLTKEMATLTGLKEGTPVATANIDAHAAVPACGVSAPGEMVMILGTSTCHLLVDERAHPVEGMCGMVEDGVIPGWWGYEAGQSGVGDVFAWFVDRFAGGKNDFQILQTKAARLKPGETGLLALDWWNGNRSVLVDSRLSGLLVGLTLSSEPHEIYRALLEATGFGTRKIIEAFTSQGVKIERLVACGGLALKSPLLLQIYADITARPIQVAQSAQTCALGAAMHASVAAGIYPDLKSAARKMARLNPRVYRPNPKAVPVYAQLYQEYTRLHDYFGRHREGTMQLLRKLRDSGQ